MYKKKATRKISKNKRYLRRNRNQDDVLRSKNFGFNKRESTWQGWLMGGGGGGGCVIVCLRESIFDAHLLAFPSSLHFPT